MGDTLAERPRPRAGPSAIPPRVVGHAGDGGDTREIIVIDKLGFFYGEAEALHDVCLSIPKHRVTAMIGPSGCGKSTLLRVLNRMDSLYPGERATGSVLFEGEQILGPRVDLKSLRRRIGMVFQESTVFPMSISENLAYGIELHERLSHADMAIRVQEILTRVDLWNEVKDRLRSPASDLSGGQQQRLCIARSLTTRPEVLLLDEPASALDPRSTAMIEQLIEVLKPTITILLVTHNLEEAARCADRVAFFYLGEMIEAGSAEQMFTAPVQARTQDYITGRFG